MPCRHRNGKYQTSRRKVQKGFRKGFPFSLPSVRVVEPRRRRLRRGGRRRGVEEDVSPGRGQESREASDARGVQASRERAFGACRRGVGFCGEARHCGAQMRGRHGGDALAFFAQIPAKLMIAAVRGYQIALSPLMGGACRFEPSCSEYMIEALKTHGAAKGCLLGCWRILRCHPFGKSGYDPVPPAGRWGNGVTK